MMTFRNLDRFMGHCEITKRLLIRAQVPVRGMFSIKFSDSFFTYRSSYGFIMYENGGDAEVALQQLRLLGLSVSWAKVRD